VEGIDSPSYLDVGTALGFLRRVGGGGNSGFIKATNRQILLLFLKKNKDLWGIDDVAKANRSRLETGRSKRVQKKIAEHEEYMRDHED